MRIHAEVISRNELSDSPPVSLTRRAHRSSCLLTSYSMGILNSAQQIRDKIVLARYRRGGTAGLLYRIVFSATMNFDNMYMLDKTVSIPAD